MNEEVLTPEAVTVKEGYKLTEQDVSLMNKRNELRNVFKELFANNPELLSVSWAQHSSEEDIFLVDEFSPNFNTPLLSKTGHPYHDVNAFSTNSKSEFILTQAQEKAYAETMEICKNHLSDLEIMKHNFGKRDRVTVSMKGFSFSLYR